MDRRRGLWVQGGEFAKEMGNDGSRCRVEEEGKMKLRFEGYADQQSIGEGAC